MFSKMLQTLGLRNRSVGSHPQGSDARYHRLRVEPLEDRRLLALLGIAPALELPIITYDSIAATEYTAATDHLRVHDTPLFYIDPVHGHCKGWSHPIHSHAPVAAFPFRPSDLAVAPIMKEWEFIRLFFLGGRH